MLNVPIKVQLGCEECYRFLLKELAEHREEVAKLRAAGNLLLGAADEFLILTRHQVSTTPALETAIEEWREVASNDRSAA